MFSRILTFIQQSKVIKIEYLAILFNKIKNDKTFSL